MFSSDWQFGYGEFWKQFFCLHNKVKITFTIPTKTPILSQVARTITFTLPKDARKSIKIIAVCKHCGKEMGKEFIDEKEVKERLEYFEKGIKAWSL